MNIEPVDRAVEMSRVLSGNPLKFGDHFFAHSFRRPDVGEQMNPLLMVDHFWMKRDTFGWHPHRGFSAVTYVFENSKSPHHNSDSMGNEVPITPGSLHWMVAGSGAMHRERPEGDDALVHGLQIFIDLPEQRKSTTPYAMHLDSQDVPEVTHEGSRIRVLAGEFEDKISPIQLPQKFTIIDGHLSGGGAISVPLRANWGTWIYAVRGVVLAMMGKESRSINQYQAVAFHTPTDGDTVSIRSDDSAQVVVLSGEVVPGPAM